MNIPITTPNARLNYEDNKVASFSLTISLIDMGHKMLIEAFNNRTRERNYFRLYSQLCDNAISENEFNKELDDNSDDYVISAPKYVATEQELNWLLMFTPYMKDMNTIADMSDMFSLKNGNEIKHLQQSSTLTIE